MQKYFLKIALIFVMAFMLVVPAFSAVASNVDDITGLEVVRENVTLGEEDPRTIAAGVINVILGFLGIIAVVIILLGGFKWMTAAGNEEKVEEAQKLIKAGIIGLVIILAAWGIASFVIRQLGSATGI